MDNADGCGSEWLALEAFDSAPIVVAVTIGPEHRLTYTKSGLLKSHRVC